MAKELFVKICHTNNSCTSVTRQVVLDNSGTPIVSFTGMPLEAHGAQFGAPFGPGLAVQGADVETGFGVPAYSSMGVARSTGLVYSTRQSYPRALVNVDVELTWPTGTPDQVKAVLIDGVLRLASLVVTTPTCQSASGRRCRVTLQGDFSSSTFATATRKWLKVEVWVTSGATTKTSIDSVEVVLVDRRSTPYGAGWWVSGVLRLEAAGSDMLLIGSTGSATIFRGSGGYYLSPPGSNALLEWTGSAWHLRPRIQAGNGSTKTVFDGQGRMTQVVDRRGNAVSVVYSVSDRVEKIRDPLTKEFVFAYNGSGKVSTITDPGGRQSKVTITASNQLTYDSIASPPANSAISTYTYTTYGSNNTLVIASRADAVGQATTVSYDARRRPTQATLASVLPETGSTPVSPVVKYRAQELRGLDTLLSQDSLFARITDPRGSWTRSRLNRWGAAERTWDTLGTVARASYTPDGFLAWGEGKVPDSTRVYRQYDALGRHIRSYRLRAPADTVLVDSLVWDAFDRVSKRFNPLRQATTYGYTVWGEVSSVTTPTSDLTEYVYRTDGLLERMQEPGQTGWIIYGYDIAWKNVNQVTNAAGVVMATNTFDGLGRTIEARRKVTVRPHTAQTSIMQWRRSRTWYLATNQVDSVRTEVTDECYSPCNAPPPWPANADTAKWQQVRYAYDRLGRDTTRINTQGKRTRYVYDGLGRLRARYPFADSTAVVDSMRYDVAGNLRFKWTRRGFLIEHRYDSRNRDTLTNVPGVGTYRRTFGGPNYELTLLWIESYSDPIGGVNPEVRWGYSQAGLLRADTAQGNRVSTYTYDLYLRPTQAVDVVGTWGYRYDSVRGVLDTLITPFADTLRWTHDARWRAVGPYIGTGRIRTTLRWRAGTRWGS